MEQMGVMNPVDCSSVDTLSKAIQRCLVVPYKISEIETPEDAASLVMLLSSLPVHYGPLTPRQALNLNKVDHYGRSALLAALLQGLGLQSYVLLGICIYIFKRSVLFLLETNALLALLQDLLKLESGLLLYLLLAKTQA